MPVIGLTGGVATGKTLVTDYLKSKGVVVIDADLLSREAVRVGEPAYKEFLDEFGSEFIHPDGTLHRKKLADLIFNSSEKRKKLEEIIHPRVYEAAWKKIRKIQVQSPDALIVFSVPLLLESRHEKEVDKVVLVYADESVQIQRLMERNGYTEEEARKRISAQMPIEEKKKRADFLIHNTGTKEETLRQVDALLSKLRACS